MDRFTAEAAYSRGPAATTVAELSPNSPGARLSIKDRLRQGDKSDREPYPIGSLLSEVLVRYGFDHDPRYASILEGGRTTLRGLVDDAATDTKIADSSQNKF